MLTIGVAVEVPEPYGSQLRAARASYGDPLAETVPTHVTLLTPQTVPADTLDDVLQRLDRAATVLPAYPMRLRGTGTFRPTSPVVFVAVSQGISYTEMLARRVRDALEAPEPEFPFHPHVTVAQAVDDAALDRAYDDWAGFECQFLVEEFALYLHDDEHGWAPQHTFRLHGGLTGSTSWA